MNKQRLLLIGAIALPVTALLLMAGIVMNAGPKPAASPEPTETPTGSPIATPTLKPDTNPSEQGHDQGVLDFNARYPALAVLPYPNKYWRIQAGGPPENNTLPLEAVVYVRPDQSADEVIAQQRPFIEQWLASIGQQPGTYDLAITSEEPHSY